MLETATEFARVEDWKRDPKHVLFVLSRYKFVAKMLSGMSSVLEVGAGDGFASEIVRREVGKLVCTDAEPIGDVIRHDILDGPYQGGFAGAFALDVLEHVEDTHTFLRNIKQSLTERGVCIVGAPSIESQRYASPISRKHHVNCMPASSLRDAMLGNFYPVFMFGMNDEVVHTGFDGMRHYNFAMGVR
jgi:hypothetical protein